MCWVISDLEIGQVFTAPRLDRPMTPAQGLFACYMLGRLLGPPGKGEFFPGREMSSDAC